MQYPAGMDELTGAETRIATHTHSGAYHTTNPDLAAIRVHLRDDHHIPHLQADLVEQHRKAHLPVAT